jgi:hypothetical protein
MGASGWWNVRGVVAFVVSVVCRCSRGKNMRGPAP